MADCYPHYGAHGAHGAHGAICRAEGGIGHITRYADGRPTRFSFERRFDRVPHVQITPDLGADPSVGFRNFWIYFLSNSGPAVDTEGFSLGVFTDVGHSVTFRWTAIEIAGWDHSR
ncbi:hypothetical protein BDV10DRAFT_188244 [Aspergillus recurvatus]